MSVAINYNHPDRLQNDAAAVLDTKNYLGDTRFDLLVNVLKEDAPSIVSFFMLADFAGIRGYPVHALARTYALDAYRAHLLKEGIETDEHGFAIPKEQA